MKKRYVSLSQMGVTTILTLAMAVDELGQAYENALLTDVIEIKFVEMTDAEYEGLKEFDGY